MSTKEEKVTTPFTWEDALACAKEALADAPKVHKGDTIHKRTIRSLLVLTKWKSTCCRKNRNLIASAPDPDNKLFQFALRDKEEGIVYELKLNTANPMAFIDKLIRKLIIYNTLQSACNHKNIFISGLAEVIKGDDYHKISNVYIFAHPKVVTAYSRPLMVHCFNMIKDKFGVTIIPKSLDE